MDFLDVVNKIRAECKRLDISLVQEREILLSRYNKRSLSLLDDNQILDFCKYLESFSPEDKFIHNARIICEELTRLLNTFEDFGDARLELSSLLKKQKKESNAFKSLVDFLFKQMEEKLLLPSDRLIASQKISTPYQR